MKIWAYKDPNFSQLDTSLKQPLEVSINPESYKRSYKPLKAEKGATVLANGERKDVKIIDPPPENFSLELWYDGTGAIPGTGEVHTEIENLKKFALYYNGAIHSTNYVKLEWGGSKGLMFKGQLQSLSIDYQLFDRTGKPLRAKASVSFIQYIDPKFRESMKNKNSPDLTHVRIAQAGDTLPLMCFRIYGNAAYYLPVARVNGLENVMSLVPGQRIVFPPIKK